MMLEELQRRNYSAITTRNYLRVVTEFAKHFGKSPDKLGPNELRTYQAYLLTERKLTPGTVVNRVAALRFLFVKTLKRHQFREFLPYPRDRRRLPTVLSREEVSQLINGAGNLFRRTLLMTLYGTGMRRAELARLKVGDVDSQRMIIRVVEGKGGKDRDLPLSPALLETLREYWRWRKPKLYMFLTRTAIASWIGIDPALAFSSSKRFGPFCAAAPQRWAVIAMPAPTAVIRPSPTTRAEIGTAPSARHKHASAGWRLANANS